MVKLISLSVLWAESQQFSTIIQYGSKYFDSSCFCCSRFKTFFEWLLIFFNSPFQVSFNFTKKIDNEVYCIISNYKVLFNQVLSVDLLVPVLKHKAMNWNTQPIISCSITKNKIFRCSLTYSVYKTILHLVMCCMIQKQI